MALCRWPLWQEKKKKVKELRNKLLNTIILLNRLFSLTFDQFCKLFKNMTFYSWDYCSWEGWEKGERRKIPLESTDKSFHFLISNSLTQSVSTIIMMDKSTRARHIFRQYYNHHHHHHHYHQSPPPLSIQVSTTNYRFPDTICLHYGRRWTCLTSRLYVKQSINNFHQFR